jgi:hypothetical protein
MEDCMIEQPCSACCRVYCNCPPEDEDYDPWAELSDDDLSLFGTEPGEESAVQRDRRERWLALTYEIARGSRAESEVAHA